MFLILYLQTCKNDLQVIFTGLVYRILYTQKKKPRYQYQYCLKAPISNFYCPDIV